MLNIKPTAFEVHDNEESYRASIEKGRDARFRIEVVLLAYKHTCGLTGYRMTTLEMESIVDAAHIQEFRDSRNNDPRNGIALSKNAHWQFDRGLWSVNDDYRVLVNREKFIEDGVPGQRLADFEGRSISAQRSKVLAGARLLRLASQTSWLLKLLADFPFP